MILDAPAYHAHIYFDDAQLAEVTALHAAAELALAELATVWPLRTRPVGPHAKPMFEIEFARASREAVIGWVTAHHGTLSVLLHPETGNDLVDHRDHAVWLGAPLPLDFSRLL